MTNREISDEEVAELLEKSKPNLLMYMITWRYHYIVYKLYDFRSKCSQITATKLGKAPINSVKLLAKGYPHLIWLIRNDGSSDSEERVAELSAAIQDIFKKKE